MSDDEDDDNNDDDDDDDRKYDCDKDNHNKEGHDNRIKDDKKKYSLKGITIFEWNFFGIFAVLYHIQDFSLKCCRFGCCGNCCDKAVDF